MKSNQDFPISQCLVFFPRDVHGAGVGAGAGGAGGRFCWNMGSF